MGIRIWVFLIPSASPLFPSHGACKPPAGPAQSSTTPHHTSLHPHPQGGGGPAPGPAPGRKGGGAVVDGISWGRRFLAVRAIKGAKTGQGRGGNGAMQSIPIHQHAQAEQGQLTLSTAARPAVEARRGSLLFACRGSDIPKCVFSALAGGLSPGLAQGSQGEKEQRGLFLGGCFPLAAAGMMRAFWNTA
ncbi:hypothetical protein O988_08371 [Pseudogymnoascus sp. VKM F-3808]|nr:hypothetical protein O988_08371 [Pseudogymnoascus sp. VKM F-3808]